MARLVARRIRDGVERSESARTIAEGVLKLVGQRPVVTDATAGANAVAMLAPAVAAIVDAAERTARLEVIQRATDELRTQATLRFESRGVGDIRGAALWDAAAHLDPEDRDVLNVRPSTTQGDPDG